MGDVNTDQTQGDVGIVVDTDRDRDADLARDCKCICFSFTSQPPLVWEIVLGILFE